MFEKPLYLIAFFMLSTVIDHEVYCDEPSARVAELKTAYTSLPLHERLQGCLSSS